MVWPFNVINATWHVCVWLRYAQWLFILNGDICKWYPIKIVLWIAINNMIVNDANKYDQISFLFCNSCGYVLYVRQIGYHGCHYILSSQDNRKSSYYLYDNYS